MNIGESYYTEQELNSFGFLKIGKNVLIKKNATIIYSENISIGDNVRIDDFCFIIAKNKLKIGSYCHISSHCVIRADEKISIGNFVQISNNVIILTVTDDFSGEFLGGPMVPNKYTKVSGGSIILEDHVLLGAGSVVLPNCTLLEGAAVGANSLVDRDLDEWIIYFGNPVRAVKKRKKDRKELGLKLI